MLRLRQKAPNLDAKPCMLSRLVPAGPPYSLLLERIVSLRPYSFPCARHRVGIKMREPSRRRSYSQSTECLVPVDGQPLSEASTELLVIWQCHILSNVGQVRSTW